ncbi:MAG: sulfotransferase [Acidobacteriia bacterium]|nr:sulfotransferase [Terriglobia bacterium]
MSEINIDEQLVFLISQPRSGSTLLQKILGAHPAIHTTSEPWLALFPLYLLRGKGVSTVFNSGLYRAGVRDFLRTLPAGEDVWWQAVRLMLSHLYGQALQGSGKSLFLDKTPRYYHVIPELQRVFPNARFILLFRNPVSVFTSILNFRPPTPDCPGFLIGNRHDLLSAPQLMLDALDALGPAAMRVQYEDLVSNPEPLVDAICAHLNIPFLPAMIEYGKDFDGGRWMFGDQGTVYKNSRPVPERMYQWRATLAKSATHLEWARTYINELGAETIERCGYCLETLTQELASITPAEQGSTLTWQQAISKG